MTLATSGATSRLLASDNEVAAKQRHHFIDEGGSFQYVDSVVDESMGKRFDRLNDQMRCRVGFECGDFGTCG